MTGASSSIPSLPGTQGWHEDAQKHRVPQRVKRQPGLAAGRARNRRVALRLPIPIYWSRRLWGRREGIMKTGRATAAALVSMLVGTALAQSPQSAPALSRDATGSIGNYSTNGNIDTTGPFFQSLGTNGRSCGSCHLAA